jgi:hypothetical protein
MDQKSMMYAAVGLLVGYLLASKVVGHTTQKEAAVAQAEAAQWWTYPGSWG